MSKFSIKVDLSNVMAQARGIVDAAVMPRLAAAVRGVAQQARIDWREEVGRAKLWSVEKAAYYESIQWKETGAFSAVVWSDYKYAQEIESGRPARDLKKMLDTSLKVRTTKTGKRYLIIPFQHNTPGKNATGRAMPQSVYDLAKHLEPSRVVGRTRRLSGTGAVSIKTHQPVTVAARKYAWGGSLPPGTAPKLQQRGGDRYAGMVRFDQRTENSKRSGYLTFRVMMEGSPGWIVPAKPGLNIVKGVTDRLQPLADQAFKEALKHEGT